VPGVLQRLLTRSGILPILRSQWRADQSSSTEKLEKRLDKRISELKTQIDRIEAIASRLNVDAVNEAVQRITTVDRELRVVKVTMANDIAARRHGRDRTDVFAPNYVGPHVARTIANVPLHTDPSVHVVVNGLVPSDTYDAMLDGIPPGIFFSQRDSKKQNLRLEQLRIAPESTLRTLEFIEHVLIPQLMVPALLRRFEPHIRDFYLREYGPERGPQLAAIQHEATSGRLMLRRPGYHLDPHLDPKRVVFTCLLYFARPGDSEAFGTSFYRMSGTPNIDRTTTFYPETQGIACDLVKMVPFKPNSAVAFLNWGGAHGADIPNTAPADTERYSYQFYVSPERAALAAIVGDAEAAIAE
jgi:hypothetical protein